MSTLYLFATALAAGLPLALFAVPLSMFGRRFFVLVSLLSVVAVALATLDRQLAVDPFFFACAGCLIAYNVVLPRQRGVDPSIAPIDDRPVVERCLVVAAWLLLAAACCCGLIGILRDALTLDREVLPGEVSAGAAVAQALSASLYLGTAVVAMTLGHWYLVSRKLSFTPLRRLTIALALAWLLRAIVVAWTVSEQWGGWSALVEDVGWTRFLLADGLFLMTRLVFGLLVPMVLILLTWRCVRIRSNQSATGILYVIVAFVLIGEILAKFFLLEDAHFLV